MKILFFGDVVGKIGRQAMVKILPKYKKKYKPDLVIINGENLAHGVGITGTTVEEMISAGVDFITTGNHFGAKAGWEQVMIDYKGQIIRPANYPPGLTGSGYEFLKVEDRRIYIINLNGRVFLQENLEDPFIGFDRVEKLLKKAKNDIVLVDFHAEASSEKNAFGWYVDGRVTAVLGTHTHVPTADVKILSKGTAYVTDVGMVGARDSVIGVEKTGPLKMFQTQLSQRFEIPKSGMVQVNAVLVEVKNNSNQVKKIYRVDDEVEIK